MKFSTCEGQRLTELSIERGASVNLASLYANNTGKLSVIFSGRFCYFMGLLLPRYSYPFCVSTLSGSRSDSIKSQSCFFDLVKR